MRRIQIHAGDSTNGARGGINLPLALMVFSLLFMAALKPEEGLGDFIAADMLYHPVVRIIKSVSYYFFIAFVAAGAIVFVTRFSSRALRIPGSILLLLSLPTFAAFRSLFDDPALSLKFTVTAGIFAALWFCAGFVRRSEGLDTALQSIATGLFAFAITLVALNLFNALTGFGYTPGRPRLFGTSVHPNFIGVQLSLAGIVIGTYALNSRGLAKISALIALPLCAYLIYQTGSRTALVVFSCGLPLASWFSLNKVARALCLIAVIGGGIVTLTSSSGPGVEPSVYDRGGVDTRAEAWGYQLAEISEKPILGNGKFIGFSENSWLRGWLAFGLPYILLSVSFLVTNSLLHLRSFVFHSRHPVISMFGGLTVGLIAGSIFEGYLTDTFTPAVLAYGIAAIAVATSLDATNNQVRPSRQSGRLHRPKASIVECR